MSGGGQGGPADRDRGSRSGFGHVGDDVLHEGHVISLVRSHHTAPDGSTFEREVVRHPGAVSVVPLHADATVTLVRQYRAALDVDLLEIPAGKRDVPHEEPALTAARELEEEVGLHAERLELLAEFVNSAGFSDEWSYVFVGVGLSPIDQDRQGLEEQHMTVERVALDDVPALIAARELIDAKTIIGLTLAREWVRQHGVPG
jgi:8-oxo-dGTP pyrophosphatase MutT (NUDIX family)